MDDELYEEYYDERNEELNEEERKSPVCFQPQSLVNLSLSTLSRKILDSPPEILEMIVGTTKEKMRDEISLKLKDEMVILLRENKIVIRDIITLVLQDRRELRSRNYVDYFHKDRKEIVCFSKELAEEISIRMEFLSVFGPPDEWERASDGASEISTESYIDYE
jgi:hypothetical protein